MKNFMGKLAVITGGASGVGFAIGEALAKEGAKVILTDIEAASLETSAKLLTDQSLDVHFRVADVRCRRMGGVLRGDARQPDDASADV